MFFEHNNIYRIGSNDNLACETQYPSILVILDTFRCLARYITLEYAPRTRSNLPLRSVLLTDVKNESQQRDN